MIVKLTDRVGVLLEISVELCGIKQLSVGAAMIVQTLCRSSGIGQTF